MATDQLAGQTEAQESAASAPSQPVVDIEKVKAEARDEIKAEYEPRIAGFQTALNRLTERNRELERSQLPEDERAELDNQEQTDRVAELERRLALRELADQYPDVAGTYQQLLEAETPEEQVQILMSLRAPAATEEAEAESTVADVDSNNPAPTVGEIIGRMSDGTPLTGDNAIEYLKRLGPASYSEVTRG